jgi:hypothetical protein
MYIKYGQDDNGEMITPVVYKDIEAVLLPLLNKGDTGKYNNFYKSLVDNDRFRKGSKSMKEQI